MLVLAIAGGSAHVTAVLIGVEGAKSMGVDKQPEEGLEEGRRLVLMICGAVGYG